MRSGAELFVLRVLDGPFSEVEGLFAWTRPGDLIVVDADAGSLRVNPAASAVEHVRSAREK